MNALVKISETWNGLCLSSLEKKLTSNIALLPQNVHIEVCRILIHSLIEDEMNYVKDAFESLHTVHAE